MACPWNDSGEGDKKELRANARMQAPPKIKIRRYKKLETPARRGQLGWRQVENENENGQEETSMARDNR